MAEKEEDTNSEVNAETDNSQNDNTFLQVSEGKRKSAIILGILAKENAQEIYKYLSDEEKLELSKAIANLNVESFDEVESSISEFVNIIKGNPGGLIESGMGRVIEILEGIVSEDEQNKIVNNLFSEQNELFTVLGEINDVNPLATMIANEEPQFIALVVTFMKPKVAADLMTYLPTDKMTEVAEGVATMGQANSEVLELMEQKITQKIRNFNFSDPSMETNGIQNIVSVINNVPRATEKKLFENIEQTNPELSRKIKESLFVFEDIVILDSRSIQKAFSVITDTEVIAKALKTASVEVKEKIVSALPKQRQDILNEELEGLGPIHRNESESAQQEISNTIKDLESNNEIVIDRGGSDVII